MIRPWGAEDAPQLLTLMKKLASFEGYSDDFLVTTDDLIDFGLGGEARFRAFVAECIDSKELVGMAVVYTISWTFDMRPTLVLKELFVESKVRGKGVGCALFSAAKEHAIAIGASRMNWTVLTGNDRAMSFYSAQEGKHDGKWQPWSLDLTLSAT